jgi:hypothetical protein
MHTGALGLFTASEPLIPPDTAPRVPNTSLQEGPGSRSGPSSRQEEPGATASGPARARRTRTVRAPRGQAPAPTGSAASWPTSEAPASMNVKLKVGNMELMYTARDTNDRDLQDRMTTLLPWLAEVMAACEANAEARQQTAKQAAAQPTPPPPPAAEPERTLDEQVAATVQAAMPAQATASPNGAGPAADGRRTPPPPPAPERTNARWSSTATHVAHGGATISALVPTASGATARASRPAHREGARALPQGSTGGAYGLLAALRHPLQARWPLPGQHL